MSSVSSAFRLLQWERRSKVALQLQWWQRPVLAHVSLPLYIHFLHRHVSLKRGNRLFMQLAHTNTHAYSQRLLVRLYFCSQLQHRLFDLELRWIFVSSGLCVFLPCLDTLIPAGCKLKYTRSPWMSTGVFISDRDPSTVCDCERGRLRWLWGQLE